MMFKLTKGSVLVCYLLCSFAAGTEVEETAKEDETPVGRVIAVISKIRREVVKESISEEAIFKKFACFCKDKTAKLEKMVHYHSGKIDLSSATIEDSTASSNGLKTENAERASNHEKMSAEQADYERQLREENANWQNIRAEFSNNKRLINSALSALKSSRNRVNRGSLLQVSEEDMQSVAQYVSMADAMGLIKTPEQKALATSLMHGAPKAKGATPPQKALLQAEVESNSTRGNPLESYGYHGGSNDVIDLIQSLMTQMQDLHNTQQDEHVKAVNSFSNMIRVLDMELHDNKRTIHNNKHRVSTLTKQIAQARQVLIDNRHDLDETDHVLKEVTTACTNRASEYDARSSARESELKALSTALVCLGKARPAADSQRLGQALPIKSLLQATPANKTKALPAPNKTPPSEVKTQAPKKATAKPTSFLQELSTQNTGAGFLGRSQESSEELKSKALAVILAEGQRSKSLMLTSLATTSASDPFEKVKKLISDLRFRLEAEAQAETNKKVFCDEELEKARHERETRFSEVKHMMMLLGRLDARRDALKESIKYNTNKALELAKSITTVVTDVSQLNAEQLAQFNAQKEARDELKEAIRVLRAYYSQAARDANKSLLQTLQASDQPTQRQIYKKQRSQIKEENDRRQEEHEERKEEREERERRRIGELDGDVPADARFSTMGDALALLETVASDFDREIANLEGDMSDEYKQFVKTNQVLVAQKEHAEEMTELDRQELGSTKVKTQSRMEDLQTAQKLLDDALLELEQLKPTCIDTGMSYKDRVSARVAEMKALRKALCILGEKSKDCPMNLKKD